MIIERICLDCIDSTHAWAKRNSAALRPDALTCITARVQTAGQGRHKRLWHSPPEVNLYMTLYFVLLSPSGNLAQLLSLSAAALMEKAGLHPQIKWPNDLLLSGKKVAGVLCESFPSQRETIVLLSMGLNVNMSKEMLSVIDQPATSLTVETDKNWEVNEVKEALLKEFVQDLALFQAEGFSPFAPRYDALLAHKGKALHCFDGSQVREGICLGILPDGRLELLLPSGETVYLSSSELDLLLT